jgi:FkbM family methyltransferase
MDLFEVVLPRRRRRRWLWYAQTAFHKDVHVTFDGDLDVWSPVMNFTARQTFVAGYRDPDVFAWLDRFLLPGMTVFDVGANVGVYGMFMARRVVPSGSCYAFEPNPVLRPYLEANKRQNSLHNLDLNFVGTGDQESEVCFVRNRLNLGQSHVAPGPNGSDQSVHVPIVRLDDFVASRGIGCVDFAKIDVEGFELQTLRGFEASLRRFSDVVVLTEIEPRHMKRYGYTRDALFAFMRGLGFSAYALEGSRFVPFEDAGNAKDAIWSRAPLA